MIRPGSAGAAAPCTSWPGAGIAEVVAEQVEKSISAETTFDTDVDDPRCSGARCWPWPGGRHPGCDRRAGRPDRVDQGPAGGLPDAEPSRTLPLPTDVTNEVFETAWALYDALRPGDRIRLLGVRIEGLMDADGRPGSSPSAPGSGVGRGGAGGRRGGGRFGAHAVDRPACSPRVRPGSVSRSGPGLPGPWTGAVADPVAENPESVSTAPLSDRVPPRRLAGKQPPGCHGPSLHTGAT